jgi:hypothetical protein
VAKAIVQPLAVSLEKAEVITSLIPGLVDDNRPRYTITTPFFPGVELPGDAGPDELDVTYGRTTLSAPSPMTHQDELLNSINLKTAGTSIPLSPVTNLTQVQPLIVSNVGTRTVVLLPVT